MTGVFDKDHWIITLVVSFIVYMRAIGGEVGATASLAPKIGPLGLVRKVSVLAQDSSGLYSLSDVVMLSFCSRQRKLVKILLKLPETGKV